MSSWKLAIIGGSGLYELEGLEDARWSRVTSPWGEASDAVLEGRIGDVELAFLPRHGRGHRLAPHEVNARANIDTLKRLGCTDVLAISAVGSLREDIAPGAFATAGQFIDRTRLRPSSFFGGGVVGHVSMADPVCPRLSNHVVDAGRQIGLAIASNVTYVAVEGPQFSTRAESKLFRQWGGDVIGMTSMPEARLAREAELPYASLCMVTDYDCWRSETAAVDIPEILRIMRENVVQAKSIISQLALRLPARRTPSPIDTCLDTAIISSSEVWSEDALTKLDAIAGRRIRSQP